MRRPEADRVESGPRELDSDRLLFDDAAQYMNGTWTQVRPQPVGSADGLST